MPERRSAVVTLLLAIGGLLAAAAVPGAQAPACAHGFDVKVPAEWRAAARLMLLTRDVSLPKNRPVVFEFHATGGSGADERLGTYGVVAESETATGRWKLSVLRVNATRPLRRWLTANPDRTTVCIRIVTVDDGNRPIERLDWTARAVEIEAVGRQP
jgi:hypothetical protein